MSFKSLQPRPDLPEVEKKVISYWAKHNILEKYLSKNEKSNKRFSFFDGPITANNPMGVHHARGRALKDLVQRFKNMQGYKQRFQNGFDCQGLWVEVEVEKSLGFNSKKDIEGYGMDRFVNACKDRVHKFADKIMNQSKRLGYFMDWDNSYFTMSERNNLHIWHFLKVCQEKGLLYKSHSPTAWCPRCETGLSKHEQADGYKMIQDTSVYIKFPIKDREGEYLLVWTTTPWTLSANMFLAVNSDLNYVRVEGLYMVEEAAQRLGFNDYEPADDLVGLEYVTPYGNFEKQGTGHKVVEWDLPSAKEGTGIVHVAPGCGEEDFYLGQELGVSVLSPIDERGNFKEGYGFLSGKYAHDVNQEIIDDLEKRDLLFKTEQITHSYPHCWRCKTKCLFRLEDNWFIKIKSLKKELKEASRQVNWVPDYVGKRMEDWLESMDDWMISRSRFYGLSLPFYECPECGKLTVIGSKDELRERAINPDEVDALPSLHRPWIDKIEIKCQCGATLKRVPEVGDCWLDAGVVPFSTLDYLTDKKNWKEWFPANFISEMIEQVRLWYYSMLVYGVVLEKTVPYEAVLSYDEVRDEKGDRMSKSKGNGLPYDEAVSKMGADAMRWLYFRRNPNAPVSFGYASAEKIKRGFLGTLWNCYRFFLGFASLETKPEELREWSSDNIIDRWIVSRLQGLIGEVTNLLEAYDIAKAAQVIEEFVVKDLSLWFIRRSRGRVGPQARDKEDKRACYLTFYKVLSDIACLLAPFLPFVTEKLWYNLKVGESVHLEDWPEVDRRIRDEKLEEDMALLREVASLGHSLRKEAKIKTRQPLSELQVGVKMNRELLHLLKDELNVERVIFMEKMGVGDEWLVKEENVKVALNIDITPELKAEGIKRESVRRIQYLRKKASLTPADRISVSYKTDDELVLSVLKEEGQEIAQSTISRILKQVEKFEDGYLIQKQVKVNDKEVELALYEE